MNIGAQVHHRVEDPRFIVYHNNVSLLSFLKHLEKINEIGNSI